MAWASPTASSRRASGLRKEPSLARLGTGRVRTNNKGPRARGDFPLSGVDLGGEAWERRFRQWASDPSSTASNMVIGLAGMIVEIACLYTSCE